MQRAHKYNKHKHYNQNTSHNFRTLLALGLLEGGLEVGADVHVGELLAQHAHLVGAHLSVMWVVWW